MSDEIKVLSLFSGCGGMDLGFEGNFEVYKDCINENTHPDLMCGERNGNFIRLPKNRFNTVFANDILREAKAAWEPHFNKSNTFYQESIVDLTKKAETGEFTFPDADIVIGGFPCQDFSVAGKRKGFNSHKSHRGDFISKDEATVENRGQLYIWMKKVIEIVKPKMFIAENVKGLVTLENVKEIIENDFRDVNEGYYVYKAQVLNAADYGVPQSRERVIFIGISRSAINNKITDDMLEKINLYPEQTHSSYPNHNSLKEYIKLKDIFSDLQEPEETDDPAQQSYSKAKWYGKHCQGNREIDLNSIGPTIRAEHHGNIEFRRLSNEHGGQYFSELNEGKKERRLTIRECARIQTFPDDYEFIRKPDVMGREYALSASSAYKIIGNAVPPLLSFHIARNIQEKWNMLFEEHNDNIREQKTGKVRISGFQSDGGEFDSLWHHH